MMCRSYVASFSGTVPDVRRSLVSAMRWALESVRCSEQDFKRILLKRHYFINYFYHFYINETGENISS